MTNNISIKKAVIVNALGKYSSVAFQLVFSAILSRLLTPAEFGVVTVMNVFVIFFELFSDLGIGTAIVQNKELDNRDINAIFTFTIAFGITLATIFCGFSFGIAEYYGKYIYIRLGIIFSISIMLTSFNVVPNALLMKNRCFASVSIRTVISCVVSYIVAIILAILGFSYYSLVIRSVVMSIILLIWNVVASKINYRFVFDLKSVRKIWSYSAFQLGATMINYFQRNLDNLLVGKHMGEELLGYYNKSYTLMQYPVTYLSQVITPVLHPILSEHQKDKQYIFDQYLMILQLLSLIGILVTGVFSSASEEIITIMFGNQWKEAVAPLHVISFSIWVQMLTGTVGCIMQSLGDTKNLFKMCTISLAISVIGIIIGIRLGSITKLAYCIVIIYWIHFFIYFSVLMRKGFNKKMHYFLSSIKIDFLLLLIVSIVGMILYNYFFIENVLLSFTIKSCVIMLVYVALLFLSKRNKVFVTLLRRSNK